MRFFNTEGPVDCARHYCLPPLERLKLPEMLLLIEQQKYFLLHAPRQTGKTTCLLALADYLNRQGRYRAVYANIEAAQAQREDVDKGMAVAVTDIAAWARDLTGDEAAVRLAQEVLAQTPHGSALGVFLSRWCSQLAQPLVLLLDEVDALVGDTLIALLRQLRGGYLKRPALFPQSVVLCGVRDLQDYRIKAESLRLGDFSRQETEALLLQHTQETGQRFTAEAISLVWELTAGQPWLVNALAYTACFRDPAGRDRSRPITEMQIERAKDSLIERRVTHLDQLADKLREPRVRRVIEALLTGEQQAENIPTDDLTYVRDLGLIKTEGQLTIANRIYQEVVPRELTYGAQLTIAHQPAWYINADGRLDR